jgi:hypothetical protein
MIAEIRDYFRGVINTIDSDLKEHDQPLISDNIADTIIQDSYFVLIGDMSSERVDSTIDSNISVTVELYKNGYNEPIDNYDIGYCKAIDVQSLAMKQDRISQLTSLKSVVSTGISTETINTNDNLFKYSIQFTVTVSYFYE